MNEPKILEVIVQKKPFNGKLWTEKLDILIDSNLLPKLLVIQIIKNSLSKTKYFIWLMEWVYENLGKRRRSAG